MNNYKNDIEDLFNQFIELMMKKGKENVRFEMILYCLGYNLRKYVKEVKRDKKNNIII